MCMKREDCYETCFDFMFMDGGFQRTLPVYLRDEFGIEVLDSDKFRGEMFALLERAHDAGIIKPVEKAGPEGQGLSPCPRCDRRGWIPIAEVLAKSEKG